MTSAEKDEVKLGQWYNRCNKNTELFRELREEFPALFLNLEESWTHTLEEVKDHVAKTNKLPRGKDKKGKISETEARKGNWLADQLASLRGKRSEMSDERKRVFFAFVKEKHEVFQEDIVEIARRFFDDERENESTTTTDAAGSSGEDSTSP